MLTKVVITLDSLERNIVQTMARQDMRGPKDQVRFLIREAARERGLLPTDDADQIDRSTQERNSGHTAGR